VVLRAAFLLGSWFEDRPLLDGYLGGTGVIVV
jgi:hypothetical protein